MVRHAQHGNFLWSLGLHQPLMEDIKDPFLDAAQNYESLGKQSNKNMGFY